MFILDTDIQSVVDDMPKVKKWVKYIKKNIIESDIDFTKVGVVYSYGFFVPKNKETMPTDEELLKLKFKKRLKYELSKVRVELDLQYASFRMKTRLPKGTIPTPILLIVTELTKIKMMIEGEFHKNKKVIDSIPEVDRSIIKYRVVNMDGLNNEPQFDIDQILDKISTNGIESLTPEEKEFLDRTSKQ